MQPSENLETIPKNVQNILIQRRQLFSTDHLTSIIVEKSRLEVTQETAVLTVSVTDNTLTNASTETEVLTSEERKSSFKICLEETD